MGRADACRILLIELDIKAPLNLVIAGRNFVLDDKRSIQRDVAGQL